MTELERWLDLAEQHARLMVANHGERDIDTLRARYAAMDELSNAMLPLLNALRDQYSHDEIYALYNARCAPIIGWEVPS